MAAGMRLPSPPLRRRLDFPELSDRDLRVAAAAQAKKEIYWVGLPRGGTDSRAERSRQEIARRRAKLEQQHGFMQVGNLIF